MKRDERTREKIRRDFDIARGEFSNPKILTYFDFSIHRIFRNNVDWDNPENGSGYFFDIFLMECMVQMSPNYHSYKDVFLYDLRNKTFCLITDVFGHEPAKCFTLDNHVKAIEHLSKLIKQIHIKPLQSLMVTRECLFKNLENEKQCGRIRNGINHGEQFMEIVSKCEYNQIHFGRVPEEKDIVEFDYKGIKIDLPERWWHQYRHQGNIELSKESLDKFREEYLNDFVLSEDWKVNQDDVSDAVAMSISIKNKIHTTLGISPEDQDRLPYKFKEFKPINERYFKPKY